MTEISFHFNAADPLLYACRLLRKATRRGAQVAVTAAADTLARLDKQLWAFDPLAFVPHLMLAPGQTVAERLAVTPVWLVEEPGSVTCHDVLVNLGARAPVGFQSFSKLIEIVSTAADERAAARQRWRHYKERGYSITEHEVAE